MDRYSISMSLRAVVLLKPRCCFFPIGNSSPGVCWFCFHTQVNNPKFVYLYTIKQCTFKDLVQKKATQLNYLYQDGKRCLLECLFLIRITCQSFVLSRISWLVDFSISTTQAFAHIITTSSCLTRSFCKVTTANATILNLKRLNPVTIAAIIWT